MPNLEKWDPLRKTASFRGVAKGSREELEILFDIFDTMDFNIITRRGEPDSDTIGYVCANNLLLRLVENTGLLLNHIRTQNDLPFTFGYVYKNPINALSWSLCQFGFASNAMAYEKEAMLFHEASSPKPFRLSFDHALSMSERLAYTSMVDSDTLVTSCTSFFYGSQIKGHKVN
jgi:hypothetical protein